MSCTLQHISSIHDVNRIVRLLRDPNVEEEECIDKGFQSDFKYADRWEDGWESSSDEVDSNVSRQNKNSKSWLQDSCVSISPSEELLVVSKDDKCVFLTKRWEAKNDTNFYDLLWSGNLSTKEDDSITCIACVPMASQQRSSEGSPDWTCIIAGFSSGYIRIYMTNGSQLLCQFLHDAPVVSIKLKTKQHFLPQGANEVDELLIMYAQAIVTIDGFSLYQSLRACRNQLARAKASKFNESVDSPPLAYRKWRVADVNKITDIANCGTFTPCFFDRLMVACNVGFNETIRGSAPAFTHFVATGENKFLNVYHVLEGSSPPMMSDVAIAVATKLTSAVLSPFTAAKGWWGASQEKSTKEPAKPKVEIGTNLSSRYFLHDKRRCSENIVVAPIGKLAVVNDAFNRILLFDTHSGLVIRMWKGYRDAECGWIVVEEELDDSKQSLCKKSLFLVIYAPKRGILEIYLTEHGGRVGAFNVGKDCRLIYNGYSYLGQTNFGSDSVLSSCNKTNQCFLLQTDGLVKAVHIPFHCALSTVHSIQAKDMHLLKRIANIVEKNSQIDMKETCKNLVKVFNEIQVPSAQHKAVNCILASSLPEDFLKECLLKIVNSLSGILNANDIEKDLEFESERRKLLQFCNAQLHLIDTYIMINNVDLSVQDFSSEFNADDGESKDLETILHLTSSECKKFVHLLNSYKDLCIDTKKNLFNEEISVASFLSCFHINMKEFFCKENHTSQALPNIDVKDDLNINLTIQLGTFLFKNAIDGLLPVSELSMIFEASKLPPKQILTLLIDFCLEGNIVLHLSTIYILRCLVSSICSLKGGAEVPAVELSVGSICQWWQCIRDKLSKSIMIGHSLVLGYICRSVAIELNLSARKIKITDESDITSNGWEAVTMEIEHWNLLIAQLESLVELNCFVHLNHANMILSNKDNLSCKVGNNHKSTKVSSRNPIYSVQGILDAGFGSIAQVVADCLVTQGVPGPCLGNTNNTNKKIKSNEIEDIPEIVREEDSVLQSLVVLRETFPYSLEKDVLWLHCAWEAVMIWKEDVEGVSMLSSALVHLNCINNACLQKGLAVMLWKAVFKESVQSALDLVEKVGKAPKDRLCKKTVGLGYKSLISFLNAAKILLEKLIEIEGLDDTPLHFETEYIWKRNKSTQRSIVEQALDEPSCNPVMLEHLWCVVTVLYLTMQGCLRGVKPRSLFDTKGKHAMTQHLHATPVLSTHFDDKIVAARQQFCLNYVTSAIKNHLDSTFEDDALKNNNSDLLWNIDIVLQLGKKFQVKEDDLRCHIACDLYASGFDNDAKEMVLYIQDMDMFSAKVMDVIGLRLARCLLQDDVSKNIDIYSRLPTTIYSWLQSIVISDKSTFRASQSSLLSTYEILQFLHSNATSRNSKHSKLINDLIECLQCLV
ncbi:rab3 GTPase-activating protein non-catalytic subunit isoform X1 [Hydra vulgaris]|uniref:rab3 GTPase-activating protein non-catalytic subunit isoform X1 n=1 Tax=Hydra vulgaris TaxID=6087 RepID=UPI001F5F7232|nr:rab3 GTPase-activating protein non-catalytic subunit isoform X1 [Hydra vulgaris]